MATTREIVEYQLRILADKAREGVLETKKEVEELSVAIKRIATESGVSFKAAGAEIKRLDAEERKLLVTTKQLSAAQSSAIGKDFSANVNNAVGRLRQMGTQASKLRRKQDDLNNSFNKGEESAKGFGGSLHLLRIAMGALVAMALFRTIQVIEENLRKAIEVAKEFETSLFRIANVERILSQKGIETSVAGLRDVIQDIKKTLPIFSEADIIQQVSLIGIMTKELGITEDKIGAVAKAIGILNVRSGESEDLLSTTNKVLTALVAPSGRGIASLGLDFGQASLEVMAFKNGILQAGESFKDLTKNEKDLLKIAILLESTGEELDTIQKFLETNTGALAEQSAEWEDLLRIVGQFFISLKGLAAPVLIAIIKGAQSSAQMFKTVEVALLGVHRAFKAWVKEVVTFSFNGDAIAEAFTGGLREGFSRFFSGQVPEGAPEWFKKLFGHLDTITDTPTGAADSLTDSLQELSEVDLEDLLDDLDKLNQKIADAERDFATKLARFDADYQTKKARLEQDYAIKREEILRSSNKKIADIETKARQRELNAEAKFQEQMRQLREKYLFNLEDALRERDARQVLRLQRQFEMDRTALTNEHNLQEQERKADTAQQLQDAIDDRDERLRLLDEERQLKLARQQADYELSRSRKEEDHLQDMADLQRQKEEKLMQFAEDMAEELGLKETGAKLLYEVLKKYYGAGGLLDGLFGEARNIQVGHAAAMIAEMNAVLGYAMAVQAAISSAMFSTTSPASLTGDMGVSTGYSLNNIGQLSTIGGQAKGGTYFADRPTHAIFGEAGPEIASFTPVSKIRSGGGAGQGVGGNISLRVSLDPDLEARIIDSSLDNVSAVIERVRGER